MDEDLKNQVVDITLDASEEKVLELNERGAIFRFDFERFRELSEETERALSFANRHIYRAAKAVSDKIKEHQEQEERGERPKGPLVMPTDDRLDTASGPRLTQVIGGRKGTHYCLKPPEEIPDLLNLGYSLVDSSDPVKTPGMTKVGGSRRISRHGVDELVLLKIPEKKYRAHLKAVSDASRGRAEGARDKFKETGKKYMIETSDRTRRVKTSDLEEEERP